MLPKMPSERQSQPKEFFLSGSGRSVEMLMGRIPVWACSPFDPHLVQTAANTDEGVNDH